MVCRIQKSSILTRAGEQRKRSQSMKSYPSSELRNMCDEHIATEEPPEKEDLLQQMLERRWDPGRRKLMGTGCFHMLRCVVMLHTVPVIPSVRGNSASIHVLQVTCHISSASAEAHTCDQVLGWWLDGVQPVKLNFLQTPIQKYCLEKKEYLGKCLVCRNRCPLVCRNLRALQSSLLPREELMTWCHNIDTTFLVIGLSHQACIAVASKQKPSLENQFLT